MSKKDRRESKRESSEIVDMLAQIKALEAENRRLIALLKMFEERPGCYCQRSNNANYERLARAGIDMGHSERCKLINKEIKAIK